MCRGGKKRKLESKENPNTSLNILVSLNGVGYYNMLDGATDTVQFLNFFEEVAHPVNFEAVCESGRKMLEDYLVKWELNFYMRLCTPLTSIPRNCVLIRLNNTAELSFSKSIQKANLKRQIYIFKRQI